MNLRLSLPAVALMAAAPLAGQAHPDGHADHPDVASVPRAEAELSPEEVAVMAPVDMLFDGMRAGDTAMIRAAFAPDVPGLVGPDRKQDGSIGIATTTVDDFASTIARIQREIDERLFDVEVRIDGILATVWAEYDVYVDGEFSHCGVDAFQLADLGEGWKIVNIADTRRREGCERVKADG